MKTRAKRDREAAALVVRIVVGFAVVAFVSIGGLGLVHQLRERAATEGASPEGSAVEYEIIELTLDDATVEAEAPLAEAGAH